MTPERSEVTVLLKAWGDGDAAALERLTPLVYAELRRIARRYMRSERDGHTLQATALVNEVYLRLVDAAGINWQNRAQFFSIAAGMMRRILVDSARARRSAKRSAGDVQVSLDGVALVSGDPDDILVAVDAALNDFAKFAPRPAKVVELRYFGGLTTEEIAQVLGTSTRSVDRDWHLARTWLTKELSG